MDDREVASKLIEITERLGRISERGVDRDVQIKSIHDTVKDTRERVIKTEAQDFPKRLDSHANAIGDLKSRVGKLETQGQGLLWFLALIAGSIGSLVVNWVSRAFGK